MSQMACARDLVAVGALAAAKHDVFMHLELGDPAFTIIITGTL